MSTDRYTILRKVLKTLGLSDERADEIVARIQEWLSEDEGGDDTEEGFTFPYHLRDNFLSPAELDFFRVLQPAVAAWAVVCPQVRLADLFFAQTPDNSEWYRARNKIERKHVDFLLCDPQTMRPLLGVELNDKSHRQPKRRKRDEFMARVFEVCGLPIAWIKVQPSYPPAQLDRFLRQKAGLSAAPETTVLEAEVAPQAAAAPTCPACGVPMILRTARRGPNAGSQFYGCPNYPTCRETIAYDAVPPS